jgi:hypothetical protein
MKPQLKTLGIALLCCAAATGCTGRQVLASVGIGAAAGAGVAGYAYAKGDLEADLKHDLDDVYKASLKVVDKRDYDLKDHDVDSNDGKVYAEIPDKDDNDRDLKINLREDGDKTHISIRVGVFGDEDLSKDILKDIEKLL